MDAEWRGAQGFPTVTDIDKGHGRIETHTTAVSHVVDWMQGDRRSPGEPRFPTLSTLVKTTTTVEKHGMPSTQTRHFLSSAHLTPERGAYAILDSLPC